MTVISLFALSAAVLADSSAAPPSKSARQAAAPEKAAAPVQLSAEVLDTVSAGQGGILVDLWAFSLKGVGTSPLDGSISPQNGVIVGGKLH
jgi:hypothetical protein